MTIDIAIAGFIVGVASFALKIIADIKSELKQCYEREASQNQRIEDCLHQIDILKYKLDGHEDKYSLAFNGLREKIEHNRNRFFEEIKGVASKITQMDGRLGEISKVIYQKQD